jgi:hypothetical protein
MVRLKVCPCFRLSGYEEFMESVANRPWDAWHVINDGRRLSLNYVSDGFYDYLKHLLQSLMCRELVGLNFPTVLVWFRRLDEARRRFIQHVGADPQRGRWSVNQDTNRNYTAEGVEEGSVIILKAKALEVSDAKLERFEERLEKLMQEIDRAKEGIRNLIRSHRRI